MAIRAMEYPVMNNIPVNNVLLSVSDKGKLNDLVLGLMHINPKINFMSTGGTFNAHNDGYDPLVLSDSGSTNSFKGPLSCCVAAPS